MVCSGVVYEYVREALPEASVLKLGIVYPVALDRVREFAAKVDRLVVVEELEPFIEDTLKAAGIACEGKNIFSRQGELSTTRTLSAPATLQSSTISSILAGSCLSV